MNISPLNHVAKFSRVAVFLSLIFVNLAAIGSTLTVTIPPIELSAQSSVFFPKVLQLALSKTEATDGPFEIIQHPNLMTKARLQAEIKRNGVIDIMWATMNKSLEDDCLPIRISLLKDLTSYRIFLIRKEDQGQFKRIRNVDDLRNFRAGQGSHWTDTEILQENQLPLVTSAHYEHLFNMLIGKRFDYFPRGLDEIWSEEPLYSNKGISIEQHIMLHYETRKYFFVNKANTLLADRVERGLNIAIADGSFDSLFYSIPGYQRGYEEITNKSRLLLTLKTGKTITK